MSAHTQKKKFKTVAALLHAEELDVCSQKATELMKGSMDAVRAIVDSNPVLVHCHDLDYSQCVQAHMRATCHFQSMIAQRDLVDAVKSVAVNVDELDSTIAKSGGLHDVGDVMHEFKEVFKTFAEEAVQSFNCISESIDEK
jgi:hypothetical protein